MPVANAETGTGRDGGVAETPLHETAGSGLCPMGIE